jgi:hypothetical protein
LQLHLSFMLPAPKFPGGEFEGDSCGNIATLRPYPTAQTQDAQALQGLGVAVSAIS